MSSSILSELERTQNDIFISGRVKQVLNIDESSTRIRGHCPWEEMMNQWSNERISVASEVSLTLIQFTTMKKPIRMCTTFHIFFTADNWDTTKIKDHEITRFLSRQELWYYGRLILEFSRRKWRYSKISELSGISGRNKLEHRFFRMKIRCRIDTSDE